MIDRVRRWSERCAGKAVLTAVAVVCLLLLLYWLMCEPMPQSVPSRSLKI